MERRLNTVMLYLVGCGRKREIALSDALCRDMDKLDPAVGRLNLQRVEGGPDYAWILVAFVQLDFRLCLHAGADPAEMQLIIAN